jgi:hypothetical protein
MTQKSREIIIIIVSILVCLLVPYGIGVAIVASYYIYRAYRKNPRMGRLFIVLIGIVVTIASAIIKSHDWNLTKYEELRALDTWTTVGFIFGGILLALGLILTFIPPAVRSRSVAMSVGGESRTIQLGQTMEQIEDALGKPSKVLQVDDKVVFVYDDFSIIFKDSIAVEIKS